MNKKPLLLWIIATIVIGLFVTSSTVTRAQTSGEASLACTSPPPLFNYAYGDDTGFDLMATTNGAISECDGIAEAMVDQYEKACPIVCAAVPKCGVESLNTYTVPCKLSGPCTGLVVGGGGTYNGKGINIQIPVPLSKCNAWGAAVGECSCGSADPPKCESSGDPPKCESGNSGVPPK